LTSKLTVPFVVGGPVAYAIRHGPFPSLQITC